MKRNLLILLGAAVAVALGGYLLLRSKPPAGRGAANLSVDSTYGPVLAMLRAPEGKTPCETAYNAFKAFEDAPDSHDVPRPFGALPDRASFLARCNALPLQDQRCLQPRYSPQHPTECEGRFDRVAQSNALFDGRPTSAPASASFR